MHDMCAVQVLHELCGGDVADAARWGGPKSLPEEGINFMQRQTMVVSCWVTHATYFCVVALAAEREASCLCQDRRLFVVEVSTASHLLLTTCLGVAVVVMSESQRLHACVNLLAPWGVPAG